MSNQEQLELEEGLAKIEQLRRDRNSEMELVHCSALIQRFPNEFELYYSRAQARARQGDTDGAIHDIVLALAINPDEPALYYFRGHWQLDAKEWQAASRDFQEAINCEDRLHSSYYTESSRMGRAVALFFLGDYTEARRECINITQDAKWYAAGQLWTVGILRSKMPSQ